MLIWLRLLYICRSDVWLSYTVWRKYCFHFLLLPCAYIISTILYPRLKAILSTSLVFYQQIYDHLILTTGQWPANTHTHTNRRTLCLTYALFCICRNYPLSCSPDPYQMGARVAITYLPLPTISSVTNHPSYSNYWTVNNHSIRLLLLVLLYCTSYPPINILIKSLLNIYRGCRLRTHWSSPSPPLPLSPS